MELVSVIIPVYNAVEYLSECLTSVCVQKHSKMEIIIIDDGSTDGSSELCDDWEIKDSRIIIKHTDNGGVSKARNIGLSLACGKYVLFLDADDVIESSMILNMVATMEEYRADVVECSLVRCSKYFDNINIQQYDNKIDVYDKISAIEEMYSCKKNKKLYWTIGGKIFRRSVIKDIYFSSDISMGEDKLFLWQVLCNANKYIFLNSPLYFYRIYPESASHNTKSVKLLSGHRANELIMKYACKSGPEYVRAFYDQYNRTLIGYLFMMLRLEPEKNKKFIYEKQKYIRMKIGEIMVYKHYNYKVKLAALLLILPFNIVKNILRITFGLLKRL